MTDDAARPEPGESSGTPGVALAELYREVILRHYQSPANRRALPSPDVHSFSQNPLCGDEMSVAAHIRSGRIADAAFEARGCSITQASADMMVDAVRGRSLTEVAGLIERFRAMMSNGVDPGSDEMGELAVLQAVRKFPVRIKCALLPWNTLADAIAGARADA